MTRWRPLAFAAVTLLLLSASALGSSISDPGGIIRRGFSYATYLEIGPGFTITANGVPLPFPFNPYDSQNSSFCPTETGIMPGLGTVSGPDCRFVNESTQTITSISELFANTVPDLSCFNEITGHFCPTDSGNGLFFSGLAIPSINEDTWTESGDPKFNVLFFGFTGDQATIASMTITASEPASMGLLLSGLLGLGCMLRRKRRPNLR